MKVSRGALIDGRYYVLASLFNIKFDILPFLNHCVHVYLSFDYLLMFMRSIFYVLLNINLLYVVKMV